MALTTGLASYWKLDESSGNASDSVGGITLTNNSVTYGPGIINNGAIFNGSANLENTGALASTPYNTPFSLSFWYKNSGTSGQWIATHQNNSNFHSEWDVFSGIFGTGSFDFQINPANAGGNQLDCYVNQNVCDGSFHHLVVTSSGTGTVAGIKMYIDGVSKTITTVNDSLSSSASGANYVSFGNRGAAGSPLTGEIDEFGLWTRELTSGEVTQLYNSGAGLSFPFGVPIVKALVVAGGGAGAGTGAFSPLQGGGGGAGEAIENDTFGIVPGSYPVTVGAGGPGTSGPGTNGSDSTFSSITSRGGIAASASTSGASGNGNAAGTNSGGVGGGGGQTGVGVNGSGSSIGGDGGPGLTSSISGSSTTYSAGGGGAVGGASSTGGNAGGGSPSNGSSASANSGGGGGGCYINATLPFGVNGGNGGDGIVIISAPAGTLNATGGTKTTSGGNDIWTFTTSGTWVFNGLASGANGAFLMNFL